MFRGSDQVASPNRRISHENISRPKVFVQRRVWLYRNINCFFFLNLDVKHMLMERPPVAIKISLLG